MNDIYNGARECFRRISNDNSGVAVVEVILILVDIFIFNYICVSSI